MFIKVDVKGYTTRYKDILKETYRLRWDRKQYCYSGRMKMGGNKAANLERFCQAFGLRMYVDGSLVVGVEVSEDEEDEVFSPDHYDETQLGLVGSETLGEPKAQGFKKVVISHNTTPHDDVSTYFEGTRFPIPRLEQEQVIPEIAKALKAGYKNIIVECPVGSGKSAMAMVIPKMFDADVYITTHLKGLQRQYMEEMPFMRSVMGRGNYNCKLDITPGCISLDQAQEALDRAQLGMPALGEEIPANLAPCSSCPGFNCSYKNPRAKVGLDWSVDPEKLCDYFSALTKAQNSRYFIGNTTYLMGLNQVGTYLKQRDLLIVDEAHTLPSSMTSFFSLDLSIRTIERLLGLMSFQKILKAPEAQQEALQNERNRVLKIWDPRHSPQSWGLPALGSIQTNTTDRHREIGSKIWKMYLTKLLKEVRMRIKKEKYPEEDMQHAYNFEKKLGNIVNALEDWNNWVWQYDDDDAPAYVSFKPLKIQRYANELLLNLGQHRILMSGTICDEEIFCEELGIDRKETCFIQVDYSSFPEKHRPIYTAIKGGRLSGRDRSEEQYRITAEAIIEIAERYPNEKGLILPFTNDLEENLITALHELSPTVASRLIRHSKNSKERNQVFADFNNSPNNEILISTYANQGYDGKTVRFCVIPKIPFPAIGDVRIAKKLEASPSWYRMMTATQMTQMFGRIVRSNTDLGDVFVLDPTFDFHFHKGVTGTGLKNYMPDYFVKAIESYSGKARGAMQTKL